MIPRLLIKTLKGLIERHATVALLGPRQVGKTTLALQVAEERPAVYLDLESPSDLAKLQEPELYLSRLEDKLVVLDEIQHVPGLFGSMRGLIDEGRRRGHRTARFLVLGSASPDLLRQSSESLAGRIVYVEQGVLNALEVGGGGGELEKLWRRGGFPESFLAVDEATSLEWRQAFIRTYLERDVPQLGPRLPAETLRRFWTMLAHTQSSTMNAAKIASGLGVSGQTVARYLDVLVDLLLVRKLTPWVSNAGKRMVRSPKVFVRDSGLVHALLGIPDQEALLGHPVVGGSWEGFVVETLLSVAPHGTQSYFYRSSGGAEVDLVLVLPDQSRWAIEIKRSLSPVLNKGFHHACEDLQPDGKLLIYPGEDRFPMKDDVEALGLHEAAREIAGTRGAQGPMGTSSGEISL